MDKIAFENYLKNRLDEASFKRVWASFFAPKKVGFFDTSINNAADPGPTEELINSTKSAQIMPHFYLADHSQRELISRSRAFNEGLIYIQNPSSHIAALALAPAISDAVLDMCASPGGKTIALASIMLKNAISDSAITHADFAAAADRPAATHAAATDRAASHPAINRLDLAAIEADKSRFFTLKKNLAKYHLKQVRTYNKDARTIAFSCAGRFDKILLDAPCSSYSHFGPDFAAKHPKELKKIAKLQAGLFTAAATALKPGGKLIYSTCTFFDAENDDIAGLCGDLGLKNTPINIDSFFTAGIKPRTIKTRYGQLILPDEIFSGFYISAFIKSL